MSDRDPLQALWGAQTTDVVAPDPAQLRAHASRFNRRIRLRNAIEYAASALVIGCFVWMAFLIDNAVIRAGCALIIAGTLYVGWRLATTARAATADDALAAASWLDFHRTALERQRHALATVWRWYLAPFAPGMLVFLAGVAFAPDLNAPLLARTAIFAQGAGFVAVLFGAVMWVNAIAAKKLGAEIEALERSEGG